MCPPFSLTVAVHPCLTERTQCGVVMSARWNLSRESDVTKCRLLSYTQTLPGWSISLDASGIKHFVEVSYCLGRFFPTVRWPAACQNHVNVMRTSWHDFPLIKREEAILFDVFSCHYDTAKWMGWKWNVKFRSVHHIRCTCSFNILKITTLTVKLLMCFLTRIILRRFTNLYMSKTFFGYWFKSKEGSPEKSDVSFWGQYIYHIWENFIQSI